jgi:hypothetical protein
MGFATRTLIHSAGAFLSALPNNVVVRLKL